MSRESARLNPNSICGICGKGFYARPWRIKAGQGLFCSRSCKAVFHQGEEKPCGVCGKMMAGYKSDLNHKRFCSKECLSIWRSSLRGSDSPAWRGGKTSINRVCEICKKPFITSASEQVRRGGKFCSIECVGKYNALRGKMLVTCPICNKSFEVQKSLNPKYCSRKCKDIGYSGENNPHWEGGKSFEPYPATFNKRFKDEIRERDGHRCALCPEPGNHVHHIDYNKDNTTRQNCITLCKKCHGKTNSNRSYWQQLLTPMALERTNHYEQVNP